MTPPPKQWYDRVADAILGDDEASGAAVHSRYALICESCFSHNGLVRESEWDNMRTSMAIYKFFQPDLLPLSQSTFAQSADISTRPLA